MSARILVALRVRATPDRAFAVFTEEIGLWWQDNPMFQFTPRSPGGLAFERPTAESRGRLIERLPGGKVFVVGEVSVWEPGRRLLFSWRQAAFEPGQDTEVEITFEPVAGETRVTVEHRGWESVPAAHVARHSMPDALFALRHAEWWRALLTELARRIA